MTEVISQSQNLTKTKIVIIGAGFGGLAMAIRLKQANLDDFIILEKADQVGGILLGRNPLLRIIAALLRSHQVQQGGLIVSVGRNAAHRTIPSRVSYISDAA